MAGWLSASLTLAIAVAGDTVTDPAHKYAWGDSFSLPAVRRGNVARFWTFSSGAESSTTRVRAKARSFSCGS
jgi:hypothetical protein